MSTFRGPDFKKPKRAKNPKVMKSLHARGVICVLCGQSGQLHHVYPRGQGGSDVTENLVGLCMNHHAKVHDGDVWARQELGAVLLTDRPDVIFYMQDKLGEGEGREWLRRRLLMLL
jgi:hypothetical protein